MILLINVESFDNYRECFKNMIAFVFLLCLKNVFHLGKKYQINSFLVLFNYFNVLISKIKKKLY